MPPRRPTIAYFSPLPPTRSGIADYSTELLPHLAQLLDITLFATEPTAVEPSLQNEFTIRPIADYPAAHWHYDLALYHMGNNRCHNDLYQMSLRYPGLVVLHDVNLHHFVADGTIGQQNYAAYSRELGYVQGMTGINLAWRIKQGQQAHPIAELPLFNRLADSSLGLIVHNQYAQAQVRTSNTAVPLCIIPELMTPRTGQPRRAALAWPADALIFAALGQVTQAKQPQMILRAFQQVHQTHPQARFLFVGEVLPEVDLASLLTELSLNDVVHSTGFVEGLDSFIDWISTADIVLNLRYPTGGETSAAALRAMAAARPVIVFDHGWYSELPGTAVRKIPVLDEAALQTAMQQLADQPHLRQQMGEVAQQTIAQDYAPAAAARAYAAFIQQLLSLS